MKPFFFAILVLLLFPLASMGQSGFPSPGKGGEGGITSQNPNVPLYKIFKGSEIQISINLWGFVGGPGHYEVPGSTTLVDLLSYAGGPLPTARLTDIRIIHADTSYENRVQVYNIEQYRDNGDLSQNPYLVPGDTIIVSGRALDVFFQTVSIVTNIMVIVTALINFIAFTAK